MSYGISIRKIIIVGCILKRYILILKLCNVLTRSIQFHGEPKKRTLGTPNLEAILRYRDITEADKSLHKLVCFHNHPKYKNNQVNLLKKANRSKDSFELKLDLHFDLDQLLKWEKRIIGLIEGRERAC